MRHNLKHSMVDYLAALRDIICGICPGNCNGKDMKCNYYFECLAAIMAKKFKEMQEEGKR